MILARLVILQWTLMDGHFFGKLMDGLLSTDGHGRSWTLCERWVNVG